jgi:hypothetical protein
MYLMCYTNENGDKVYTLKVSDVRGIKVLVLRVDV